MGTTIGRVKPILGRQAKAALIMDRVDLTFDTTAIHRIYPGLPTTSLTDLLTTSSCAEASLAVRQERPPPRGTIHSAPGI